jgi:hypothetical protein
VAASALGVRSLAVGEYFTHRVGGRKIGYRPLSIHSAGYSLAPARLIGDRRAVSSISTALAVTTRVCEV